MGYSHYWHRADAFQEGEFLAFAERAGKILDAARAFDLPIIGPDGKVAPQLDGERIAFNAAGSAGAGDFAIERVVTPRRGMQLENGLWFEDCKTQQCAYDAVVTAVLAAAHHRWGERFQIDSDGFYADWEEGARLARRALAEPAIVNPRPMPGTNDW